MTTYTITGYKLTYQYDPVSDSDSVVAVSTAQALVTVANINATFTYQITDLEDGFPIVDLNGDTDQVVLDGFVVNEDGMLETFPPVDVEAALGRVTWSGGTTTALALDWESGLDLNTDLIFILDGAPLPSITTPAEWEAFDNSIIGASTATGMFAPGQNIKWSEFDNVSVTEDDEFYGTDGRDVFRGRQGDDYFISSAGADEYLGGSGWDQVTFRGDPNGVVVNLATGRAKDGFGFVDKLYSIEAIRGSMYDDRFIGSDAHDVFRGLAGDDVISGGDGRDQVRYDRDARYGGTDGVDVDLLAGTAIDGFGDTDTLLSIQDVRGSDNLDKIRGSNANNTLEGLKGGDKLYGLKGNDVLDGDEGKDRLDGGYGNDILTGGSASDLFVFAHRFGNDTITDFNTAGTKEKIVLRKVAEITSFNDLARSHLSENANGDAVITASAGNTITLEGVSADALQANDFLF